MDRDFLTKKLEKRSTELLLLSTLLILGTAFTASSGILGQESSDELVAEYRFDEGAGNTAYDTAGDNDGTINGANWTEGESGKALEFDGNDDSVQSGFNSQSGRFTVSAWIKGDSFSHTSYPLAVSEWQSGGNRDYLFGYHSGDGKLYAQFNDEGSDNKDTLFGPTPSTGKWYHVALSYNGTRGKFFVNGKVVDSALGPYDNTPSELVMGSKDGGGNYWKGKIDEVRKYSRTLNSSEVKALYNQGGTKIGSSEGSSTGKVLDIGFTKKNSTHVFDTSGENNHGEPSGATQENAVSCKVGRCYDFQGGSDVIETQAEVSDLGIEDNSEKTTMAWARVEKFDTGGIWQIGETADSKEFSLRTRDTENDFRAQLWSSGDFDFTCDAKNEWVHYALVHDGSKTQAYCNGILAGSQSQTVNTTDDVTFTIGEWNGDSLTGQIDQVKVYSKALSQREIVDNTRKLESSGAVLDMRFDSGGGDLAYDSSGSGNDGRLKPNESAGPDWVEGVSGNALSFDGSDDYVKSTQEILDSVSNTSFSISTWVYRESESDDTYVGFIDGSWDGFILMRNNANFPNVRLGNVDGDRLDLEPPNISQKEWTHVVLTYDQVEGKGKVYYDSELKDVDSFTNSESNNVDVTNENPSIGRDGRDRDYFQGDLDNFRIYPYAVSSSKVQELYSQGSSRIGETSESSQPQSPGDEGLELYQSFDRVEECGLGDTVSCPSGVSGEVAVDESSEGRHAELFSDPVESGSAGCKVSGCLDFDGNDDYLNVSGYKGVSGTQARAVSMWYKSDISGGEDHRMVSWGADATGEKYDIRVDDGNGDALRVENAGGQKYGSIDVMDREWHHLAVVFPEGGDSVQDHKLYVDGVLDNDTGGGDQSLNTASSAEVQIGKSAFHDENVDGKLDEVRIYNRSLSENEVWSLYSKGRDRKGSDEMAGPTAWWRMDQETNPLYDMAEDNSGETNLLGEVGSFNTSDGEWKEIEFDRSYYDPVIVGTTNTQNGEPGLVFEVRNVENSSAEMRLCESEGNSSAGCDTHGTERAGYLVIDSRGANQLSGIEAGTASVAGGINTETTTVNFDENFGSKPIVFFAPQNDSGARPVEVWPDSTPTADNVTFGICHQDSSLIDQDNCVSDHPSQEVGYVALSPGNIPFDQKAETASLGSFSSSNWAEATFSSSFNSPPVTLFEVQDDDGGQDSKIDEAKNITSTSGWVRFCEIDGPDTCDGHIDMEYGYAAFEEGILTTSQSGNFPSFVEGKTGRALEFDGSDDYLNITSGPDFTENESFSASIWVDSDLDCTSNRMDLISMVDPVFLRCDDRSDSGFGSPGNTFSSGLHFEARSSADGNYYVAESGSLDRSGWNHITGVYNGSAIKIYENGKLQDSVAVEGIYQENGSFTLGSSGTSNYFDGTVDDVRIYPYALSEEQVRQVYNGGGVSVR